MIIDCVENYEWQYVTVKHNKKKRKKERKKREEQSVSHPVRTRCWYKKTYPR